MFPRLASVLVALRADFPEATNLLRDCRLVAFSRGEDEALAHAEMLRKALIEYRDTAPVPFVSPKTRGAPT